MSIKRFAQYVLLAIIAFISAILMPYKAGIFGYISIMDAIIIFFCKDLKSAYAMIAAGLSASIADIVLGYSQNATASFIIRAILAYLCCYLYGKKSHDFINGLLCLLVVFLLNTITGLAFYGNQITFALIKVYGIQFIVCYFVFVILSLIRKKLENR